MSQNLKVHGQCMHPTKESNLHEKRLDQLGPTMLCFLPGNQIHL